MKASEAADGELLSASLEDYLEAILHLEQVSRVARVSEIAEQLKVSRPSVTGALKNLAARGLVSHVRYGHATLTEEGAKVAREVERRHVAIRDFLTSVLGIGAEQAETTACKLEHVLEAEVLAHFVSYADRLRNTPRSSEPEQPNEAETVESLARFPTGSHAVVTSLPQAHGLAQRLIGLGLTPGAEVRVVQNRGNGPLIVEVHGARLALGRRQAERVNVRLIVSPDPVMPELTAD